MNRTFIMLVFSLRRIIGLRFSRKFKNKVNIVINDPIVSCIFILPVCNLFYNVPIMCCRQNPQLKLYSLLIHSLISSTLHAVILAPNFTGFGNLPALTPAHQVDLLTGMIFRIAGSLTKPISGSSFSGSDIDNLIKRPCSSLIQITSPPCHHLTSFRQILGMVITCSNIVSLSMGKLALDHIWPKAMLI